MGKKKSGGGGGKKSSSKSKSASIESKNSKGEGAEVARGRVARARRRHAKKSGRTHSASREYRLALERLTSHLSSQSLRIHEVSPDGNCLFRCFSIHLYGDPERHIDVRNDICDYMFENRDFFAPFCEDDEPFGCYCDRMRRNAVWGGNMEIQAFSMINSVSVCVFQDGGPRIDMCAGSGGKISLAYHGAEHYNLVIGNDEVIGKVNKRNDNGTNNNYGNNDDSDEDKSDKSDNNNDNVGDGDDDDDESDISNNNTENENDHSKNKRKKQVPVSSWWTKADDKKIPAISRRTGCEDIAVIKEALIEVKGNFNRAVRIVEEVLLEKSDDEDDDDANNNNNNKNKKELKDLVQEFGAVCI